MKARFVFVPRLYPGLANSLLAYATLLAVKLEMQNKISIFFFSKRTCDQDAPYPQVIHPNLLLSVIARCILKLLTSVKSCARYNFFPGSPDSIYSLLKNSPSRLVFVDGWGYNENQLLFKYRPHIIKELGFSNYVHHSLSDRKNTTIALHVRRADYKSFLGGKYYYAAETYRLWVHHARFLLNQTAIVQIFTDDPSFAEDHLSDLGDVSKETPVSDLVNMAHADYIVGPPSTFSMLASFLGETPVMPILSKTPNEQSFFLTTSQYLSFNANT